ncbi:porin (plasmid) [Pseudoalteromonas sp. T1lg65]|uniref:porin n=1 Tax=Pseudoalteromonas sp. T1lg65 TaxID=2077101 RepID=UPI003F7947A3
MKFKLNALFAAVLSVAAAPSFADTDFIQAGYGKLKIDNLSEIKPAGFSITANKAFDGFYAEATYETRDDDLTKTGTVTDYYGDVYNASATLDMDYTRLTLLIGHEYDLGDDALIDIYGGYSRAKLELDLSASAASLFNSVRESERGSASVDLYHLEAAYDKSFGAFNARVGLGVERAQGDGDNETNFVYLAGLGYQFTNAFSMHLAYRNADEYDTVDLGFRYHF